MRFAKVRQFSFELLVLFLAALVFMSRIDWMVAFVIGYAACPAIDRAWRRIMG